MVTSIDSSSWLTGSSWLIQDNRVTQAKPAAPLTTKSCILGSQPLSISYQPLSLPRYPPTCIPICKSNITNSSCSSRSNFPSTPSPPACQKWLMKKSCRPKLCSTWPDNFPRSCQLCHPLMVGQGPLRCREQHSRSMSHCSHSKKGWLETSIWSTNLTNSGRWWTWLNWRRTKRI